MNRDSLTVIDISSLEDQHGGIRQPVARQIASACHEVGFMAIVGHGIPLASINRLRSCVMAFFDRPLAEKLALSVTPDNYRGYIPLNFFTANAGGANPDRYEGYKLHRETDSNDPIRGQCSLYGPNKWPLHPFGLQQAVEDYWQHCNRITAALLHALACELNVDADVFQQAFRQPLTNMTLLHYPPQAAGQDGIGIHPHKDTDVLTLLAPDPVGGLQVRRTGDREWLAADAPDGALIVNVGDLLETWSGGYFVSTPHRVVNAHGRERYSFPYFAVPRHDIVVTPLRSPAPGGQYHDIPVGEVSRQIWQSNWPDATPIEKRYDPATV